MEMSVRADFFKAFAELNVDMNDITAEIEDSGIPCLDYRTYVTNLFFPSFKYHPCMRPRDVVSQAFHWLNTILHKSITKPAV